MNWDKIEQLLNVADKALKWPHLKTIHDQAIAEVNAMIAPKAELEGEAAPAIERRV